MIRPQLESIQLRDAVSLDVNVTNKDLIPRDPPGSAQCAKNAHCKIRQTSSFYNLDAIISVGYRVNSKRGPSRVDAKFATTATATADLPPLFL